MRIEKRNQNYRVQKMIDGKRYSFTYDHKPTQREVDADIVKIRSRITVDKRITFKMAAGSYIGMKRNVLSASTLYDYAKLPGRISNRFNNLKIDDITQADIQIEINNLSKDKSPKTVRNIHGFISAVLRTYRPDMVIYTTLPQRVRFEPKLPTRGALETLLKAAEGTEYEIPFKLGCLGLRRSEICALKKSDINGNSLTINKALVYGRNGRLMLKTTKTTESSRTIYIPDKLVELINLLDTEEIYTGHPSSILRALHRYQDRLNLPRCRFHDLRHYYASYAHSRGMSDADIMSSGGWKTDAVMKNIYRHSLEETKEQAQKKIADSIF